MFVSCDYCRIAVLVSSVPLSLTMVCGLPRRATIASSSRPTLAPESEVSATSARHSRVKSSTTGSMRNRRLSVSVSLTKSSDQRHWCPGAERPLAATTPAHLQAFVAVQAAQLLVVLDDTLEAQQGVQPPITEATAQPSQISQSGSHRPVVRAQASVPHRAAVLADRIARPPLAHLEALAQVRRGLPSGSGRHHFLEATSFNIALSSIASASSFFSRRFSSSNAFRRRVRDVQAAVLRLPLVERGAADAMVAANLSGCRSGFLLARTRRPAPR